MHRFVFLALLSACSSKEDSDTSGGSSGADGIEIPSDPSDGVCPDMTSSGTATFSSSGEERIVTVVAPQNVTEGMPLVFFFHGLLSPASTPRPTEYMASALRLQTLADDLGVVLLLPQSDIMERLTMQFFMWDVESSESADLVLFDDLRACAYRELNIDLSRVHAMGFSGGALFSTVVAAERSNILASMVQMSGGSDIDMMTFEQPLSRYSSFDYSLPSLLITGGSTDEWPGDGLTLVDFTAATDTLQSHLVDDGHYVVRCEHNYGHTVPPSASAVAREWIEAHRHGDPSPIQSAGIEGMDSFAGWCVNVSN